MYKIIIHILIFVTHRVIVDLIVMLSLIKAYVLIIDMVLIY